jgi:succinate dehydrogenase/fumarate reductase flavoprotein subunit
MNKHQRTFASNNLVIGSGAAGIRTAIATHQAGSDVIVLGVISTPINN